MPRKRPTAYKCGHIRPTGNSTFLAYTYAALDFMDAKPYGCSSFPAGIAACGKNGIVVKPVALNRKRRCVWPKEGFYLMCKDSVVAQVDAVIASDRTAQECLRLIVAHFDAQTGTIHRLDDSDGRLKLIAHIGIPEVIMDKVTDIPVGKGIAGAAASERRPVTICNIKTDTSGVVGAKAPLTGMEGAVAVPMIKNGQLHGTLGVGKRTEYTWSEAETSQLEEAATLLCSLV